jgi:hypothetical protein
MATTVLELIEDSLREINVISEVASASPEQGAFCLRRLNQMMALLKETSDFDVGYFSQATTTGDMPTPEWANLAITLALSIAIASKYGASASGELIGTASSAMSLATTKLIVEKKKGVDLSYLPVGSGHYGRGNNILTDS